MVRWLVEVGGKGRYVPVGSKGELKGSRDLSTAVIGGQKWTAYQGRIGDTQLGNPLKVHELMSVDGHHGHAEKLSEVLGKLAAGQFPPGMSESKGAPSLGTRDFITDWFAGLNADDISTTKLLPIQTDYGAVCCLLLAVVGMQHAADCCCVREQAARCILFTATQTARLWPIKSAETASGGGHETG